MKLDSKVPSGPLEQKWQKHQFEMKLVNPANKRKYSAIVVGTGLAGASAAASLAELGYEVKAFCFQDFLYKLLPNPFHVLRRPMKDRSHLQLFFQFSVHSLFCQTIILVQHRNNLHVRYL